MALHKDTSVRISLATMAVVLLWIGSASWKVFGYVDMIEDNSKLVASLPTYITRTEAMELVIASNSAAISEVSKSLRVGRLDRNISERKKEKRDLSRALRRDPTNELLKDQIDTLTEEVEYFTKIRKCVIDDVKVCT